MLISYGVILLVGLIDSTLAVLCYNCSSTNKDWSTCAGTFAITKLLFNNSRVFLVNCTSDDAMCFVRSWSSRTHFAWIVQRGCYQSPKNDPLLQTLRTPKRAMACKRERLADAEYQVCLCKADWCNLSPKLIDNRRLALLVAITSVTMLI